MTQVMIASADLDGRFIGLNGLAIQIPFDTPFEASAEVLEIFDHAGVIYQVAPFNVGLAGQIRISTRYRGPRWVMINGQRYDFPVGVWFAPSAALIEILRTLDIARYITPGGGGSGNPFPDPRVSYITSRDAQGNLVIITTTDAAGKRYPVTTRTE